MSDDSLAELIGGLIIPLAAVRLHFFEICAPAICAICGTTAPSADIVVGVLRRNGEKLTRGFQHTVVVEAVREWGVLPAEQFETFDARLAAAMFPGSLGAGFAFPGRYAELWEDRVRAVSTFSFDLVQLIVNIELDDELDDMFAPMNVMLAMSSAMAALDICSHLCLATVFGQTKVAARLAAEHQKIIAAFSASLSRAGVEP